MSLRKRELAITIRDNWFTDIHPTYSQYLGVSYSNLCYRLFGYVVGQIILCGLTSWIFRVTRVLEIVLYRRQQLDYYDR